MEKVDDLLLGGGASSSLNNNNNNNNNLRSALDKRLGGEEDDTNLVLQLGSNDGTKLETCVKVATENYPNLKEINLNCGCPSIDTGGASTYGARLMKDPSLTAQLVDSMCSAASSAAASNGNNIDISVKCRIGVFDNDNRPLTNDDYQYLTNYISGIHNAGANHIILHARPAILSLSPVKNRNVPPLNYEFVHQIASEFDGRVKITMNGGITSLEQLCSFQSHDTDTDTDTDGATEKNVISSHMAGRWCLRRPLDLVAIEERFLQSAIKTDAQTAIDGYIDFALENQSSSQFTMAELCLPLYLIVEQLKEDYDQEDEGELLSWEDMENLYDTIQEGLIHLSNGKVKTSKNSSINFKKLANSFKSVVGTKVVNKWKRNRAEL